MRRHVAIPVLAFLQLFFLPSCEKDSERMENYLVEFASVEKENSNFRFRLDNGTLLIPKEVKNYSGEVGQRVYLNYVPLEGNYIKINYLSNIFTGAIKEEGFPDQYANDPLKIQSVWIGGNWLNLILETEYNNVAHTIALFRDAASETVDLYLSHSKNDDPPGYPIMMYSSFLLSSLREPANETSPAAFRLFINTNTELRVFNLELK